MAKAVRAAAVVAQVAAVLEAAQAVVVVVEVLVGQAVGLLEADLPMAGADHPAGAVPPLVAEEVLGHEDTCSRNLLQQTFGFSAGFRAHADDLGNPAHVRHSHGGGGIHHLQR